MEPTERDLDPARRDEQDPLRGRRELFVGEDTDLVYFDGNSLGRPLRATAPRLTRFVEEEWGGRLIRGWDERWYDLPLALGDELGRVVLGAAPGQSFVGDSTTVLLYKLARAAVDAASGRDEIVVDTDNFPTDRYVAEGIAAERGLTVRWIETDPTAGVTPDQAGRRRWASAPRSSCSATSTTAPPGWPTSLPSPGSPTTPVPSSCWDLCHSVGVVPMQLDAWGVDMAVGCTYKYLNGGPGSPAFAYVASRHLDRMRQPIQGWMGHADPFLMGPGYEPASTVRRFISGTPPILGMLALEDMVALLDEVGMAAVREKSVALTEYARELAADLVPEATLASPSDPARRGGHLTLRHDRMQEVVAALWRRDVIPDYRDPGGLRIGLSALSTSFSEVHDGLVAVREELHRLI